MLDDGDQDSTSGEIEVKNLATLENEGFTEVITWVLFGLCSSYSYHHPNHYTSNLLGWQDIGPIVLAPL